MSRIIFVGKLPFIAIDIGCPDFEAAKASRERQKSGYAVKWWLWYEELVRRSPRNKPLPFGLPSDEILGRAA